MWGLLKGQMPSEFGQPYITLRKIRVSHVPRGSQAFILGIVLFISTVMASPSQIADVLKATLNPDTNTRVAAELSLAELFTQPSSPLSAMHEPYNSRVKQALESPYPSSFWPRMQRSH